MDTLDYIVKKYNLNINVRSPIEIPNIGRDNLPELFKELGFKVGAEIGVYRGQFSEKLFQSNPNLKLYCVDPWTIYKGYEIFGVTHKESYQETKERTSKYNCTIIRRFSMDAVKDFEDESLDFVYIDANHNFQSVVNDLCEWSRKVKVGGIVCGHDYSFVKDKHKTGADSIPPHTASHVVEAVVGYTQAFVINPWFLLGKRWTKPGEHRDKRRSFMWVRGQYV